MKALPLKSVVQWPNGDRWLISTVHLSETLMRLDGLFIGLGRAPLNDEDAKEAMGANRADGGPFETMVFKLCKTGDKPDSWRSHDCERYRTEPAALAGHQRMVEKWSRKP